jgi:hypothetical protein
MINTGNTTFSFLSCREYSYFLAMAKSKVVVWRSGALLTSLEWCISLITWALRTKYTCYNLKIVCKEIPVGPKAFILLVIVRWLLLKMRVLGYLLAIILEHMSAERFLV